jgi:hypothetical protein
MSPTEISAKLKSIMEAHDLTCTIKDEWVCPNGQLPAICALWFPREKSGVLSVRVLIKDGILLEECFAGIGTGEDGLHDALKNFMSNSLHVFLAVFWKKNDAEQITTERWEIGGRNFNAYIGNFGTRTMAGCQHVHIPDQLFSTIQSAIVSQSISTDLHWVRMFFSNYNGEPTFEALLDNEEWPAGIECLKLIPWEKANGYYSVRNFLIIRPASQETRA